MAKIPAITNLTFMGKKEPEELPEGWQEFINPAHVPEDIRWAKDFIGAQVNKILYNEKEGKIYLVFKDGRIMEVVYKDV